MRAAACSCPIMLHASGKRTMLCPPVWSLRRLGWAVLGTPHRLAMHSSSRRGHVQPSPFVWLHASCEEPR